MVIFAAILDPALFRLSRRGDGVPVTAGSVLLNHEYIIYLLDIRVKKKAKLFLGQDSRIRYDVVDRLRGYPRRKFHLIFLRRMLKDIVRKPNNPRI